MTKRKAKKPPEDSGQEKMDLGVSLQDEVKPTVQVAKDPLEEAKAEDGPTTSPQRSFIEVQSLWPARLIVRGAPTGNEYIFPKAGAIVAVDKADVDFLLSKNQTGKRGCCGGGERIYFSLI